MGLDGVELVVNVEDRFNTSIPGSAAEHSQTVGDLPSFLMNRIRHQNSDKCSSAAMFYPIGIAKCSASANRNVRHRVASTLIRRDDRVQTGKVTPMSRVIWLLALTLACGCGPSGDAFRKTTPTTESDAESPKQVSAFEFNQAEGIITLNTRIPPRQRRRFDIGQGSVTLETIGMEDSKLTFQYTPEIEGGYTVYECTVPVSPALITIRVNTDGTPGDTSFDLAKCKVIRNGSVLLDQPEVGQPSRAPGLVTGPPRGKFLVDEKELPPPVIELAETIQRIGRKPASIDELGLQFEALGINREPDSWKEFNYLWELPFNANDGNRFALTLHLVPGSSRFKSSIEIRKMSDGAIFTWPVVWLIEYPAEESG